MTEEIVLITRTRTLNKGNQALSIAWIQMIERAFPGVRIRVLERKPRHLLQYELRHFTRSPDPFRSFDARATRLARGASNRALPPPDAPRVLLDETISPPAKFVRLRQRLNLRGRVAALGLYARDYEDRLTACRRAKLVVVNPAGEFYPREPEAAFHHLLDAHVAQKLGRPTAIVNHTLDLHDPTLRRIIPAMYRTLALVGFRDDKSLASFRSMGGDPSNVLVTPDLVLSLNVDVKRTKRDKTIGVAINVPEAAAGKYLTTWREIVAKLGAAGFKVELISNELPADKPFYDELAAEVPGLSIEGANLEYDEYCERLASYDFIVSSRMHTAILAMLAGTPVVAVEGSSFKITGLFQELGFTQPVIRPAESGWAERVVARATALSSHLEAANHEASERVDAARQRIIAAMVPRLRSAAEPGAAVQSAARQS